VRETGGLTDDDTNPGATLATRRHVLDPAVVELGGGAPAVLDEDLREVAPRPQSRSDDPLDDCLVDHRTPLTVVTGGPSPAPTAAGPGPALDNCEGTRIPL
jgi:hypothetical protein